MVIDPFGGILLAAEPGQQAISEITLSLKELRKFRESWPFGQDWDQFTIKP